MISQNCWEVIHNFTDIEILKDSWGNAFWPTYNLNNVGNLAPGQAYQIKMNDSTPIQFNLTD